MNCLYFAFLYIMCYFYLLPLSAYSSTPWALIMWVWGACERDEVGAAGSGGGAETAIPALTRALSCHSGLHAGGRGRRGMRSDTQPSNVPWRLTACTHRHTHTPQCKITVNGCLCCGVHPYRFQRYVFTTVFFFFSEHSPPFVLFWLIAAEPSLFVTAAFKWFKASLFSPVLMARRLVGSAMIVLSVLRGDKIIIGHLEQKHYYQWQKQKCSAAREAPQKWSSGTGKSRLRTARWQTRTGRSAESPVFVWLTFDYWRSLLNLCHPS